MGHSDCMNTAHTTGSKYESTASLCDTEIAKLIRADIKAAIKSGELPAGLKCSVRCSGSSLHSSIEIRVTAAPGVTYWRPEFLAHEATSPRVLFEGDRITDDAKRILNVLNKIHGAYNFDNSDSQTDYFHVRYYGSAEFGWELQREDRKRTIESMAAQTSAAASVAQSNADAANDRVRDAQERLRLAEQRAAELQAQIDAVRVARDAVIAEIGALRGQHAGQS
jgi:hypothetical protein